MTEKRTQPYNIKEKEEKNAPYRSLIRAELADELYDKILNIILIEKRYRDKDFSAKELAKELNTNTRYISAVINSRFNTNFSCLVNEYRVKEAQHRLTDTCPVTRGSPAPTTGIHTQKGTPGPSQDWVTTEPPP